MLTLSPRVILECHVLGTPRCFQYTTPILAIFYFTTRQSIFGSNCELTKQVRIHINVKLLNRKKVMGFVIPMFLLSAS